MTDSQTTTIAEEAAKAKDLAIAKKHLLTGIGAEERGERQEAIDLYELAYASDPDNIEVCFRLAYNLDLVGEEDEALHLYEQTIQQPHPPLSALMNLAVIYDDRGNYALAERCLRQVLATDPNHARARLFIKDVLASKSMVIDDEKEGRIEKESALLETPVTDFDLSVRARNALRKMNIRTLADLLKVTEAELRNFKNFGEASLEEIKTMLAQRGLRLGQAVEQQLSAVKRAVYDQLKADTGSDDAALNKPVAELNFSVRARKALALLNVQTVGDLCLKTEAELIGVKNFGMTSLLEIKEKLGEMSLSLRLLKE